MTNTVNGAIDGVFTVTTNAAFSNDMLADKIIYNSSSFGFAGLNSAFDVHADEAIAVLFPGEQS